MVEITLDYYLKLYGNNPPKFDYDKETLIDLYNGLKNGYVESGRSLFPVKEYNRDFYNYIIKGKSLYQFVYQFFPNYFEVRTKKFEPLINVFKDNNRLQKSIDMYNKYYGIKKDFDLTYFIKPVSMSSNVYKAGNFSPFVAKYIYDTFTTDGDIVFDFSAGFGGRMLGAMASRNKIHYEGIEPYLPTYEGLNDLYYFFQMGSDSLLEYNSCELYNTNIEEFEVPEELINKVSICFSSPPFYDLELYCSQDNPYAGTQASYLYENKEEFMKGFFGAVVEKSEKMLTKDGLLIVNLKDSDRKKTVKSFLSFMKTTNFKEVPNGNLLVYMNNMTHGTSLGKKVRTEPIFVFKKKQGK